MCVSTLLEHLLESEELLVKHSSVDGSNNLPNTKPSEPRHHDLTDRPPETTTAHFAARSDPEAEAAEVATAANLQESEQTPAASGSPASAVPPTARRSTCPSSSYRVPAVIFVGFGTGANALLHLTAGPLRALSQSPKHAHGGRGGRGGGGGGEGGGEGGQGREGDGGRDLPDGNDSGGNEQEQGSDIRGDAEASCGLLASVLRSKGLRVGGLVLANGFVSLDEQSTQARGPRRRCDSLGVGSFLKRVSRSVNALDCGCWHSCIGIISAPGGLNACSQERH